MWPDKAAAILVAVCGVMLATMSSMFLAMLLKHSSRVAQCLLPHWSREDSRLNWQLLS